MGERNCFLPAFSLFILVNDPRCPDDYAMIPAGSFHTKESAQREIAKFSKVTKWALYETSLYSSNPVEVQKS